jgi:hypothetical protein
MVAAELKNGREIKMWQDELLEHRAAPFPVSADCLFVAYYASAELGCFLSLGWPLPVRVLDLYTEFRVATNGLPLPCGRKLLGALQWYRLPHIDSDYKEEMQQLAMRGGEYTAAERKSLIDYCSEDVIALGKLLRPISWAVASVLA